MSEHELYLILNSWLNEVSEGKFEKFEDYRNRFGKLEPQVFGDVSQRCKNPRAMQYGETRDHLVWAKQDPSRIKLAREIFQKISKPA